MGRKSSDGDSDKAKQLSLVPTTFGRSGVHMKTEECPASSSCSNLESYFVGMGFSQKLVEKVLDENGDADDDSLLETLLAYTALQESGFENLNMEGGQTCSKVKVESPNEDDGCSVDFSFGSSQDNEEDFNDQEDVNSDKRKSLLSMKFSEEEVDCAVTSLGGTASLEDLVDFILSPKGDGSIGDNDKSANQDNSEVLPNESLFGTMEKTLQLLSMGFSENDVSEAIDNFGAKVPVQELADSIFAQQLANMPDYLKHETIESESVKTEDGWQLKKAERSSSRCCPSSEDWEFPKKRKIKSEKCIDTGDVYGGRTDDHLPSIHISECLVTPIPKSGGDKPGSSSQMEKKQPDSLFPGFGRSSQACSSERPYFLYGSVVELSTQLWKKLAQFLYNTNAQFVDTGSFSALKRTEGYIHNFPAGDRTLILPQPPMLIKNVFPHMKKWWPTWDTRKQMTYIYSEPREVSQSSKRLEELLLESQGMLSEEQHRDIVCTCERYNLTWLGPQNLGPFEPEHVEQVLGFPLKHTEIGDLRSSQRLKLLKGSFQTDTLGYHLSFLKSLFPSGLNLLSIFSGIGGVEVSLHRLGIHLKAVLCVEPSRQNREIIRRWWSRSGQTGELVIIEDIATLRVKKLEEFMRRFGELDLVVVGNPCSHADGETSGEVNYPFFFESVRVLKRARQLTKKRRL